MIDHLFVWLLACLLVCSFDCLFVCLFVWWLICWLACLYVLFVRFCLCLSVCNILLVATELSSFKRLCLMCLLVSFVVCLFFVFFCVCLVVCLIAYFVFAHLLIFFLASAF